MTRDKTKERITSECEKVLNHIGSRSGIFRTTCPECSHKRKKKNVKCFAVTRTGTEVKFFCHHCGFAGGSGEVSKRAKLGLRNGAEIWNKRVKQIYNYPVSTERGD